MAPVSIILLALVASLAPVSSVPVAVQQRDVATDPAVLAAYESNPKLAAIMGASGVSKRDIHSDPAVVAAYEANPALAAMMQPGSMHKRAERLAPIKVDVGPDDERPASFVDAYGNGRALPISDVDANGHKIAHWGDVAQKGANDCWYLATLMAMTYVNPYWPLSRLTTPGGEVVTDRATVTLTGTEGELYSHIVFTKDLQAQAAGYADADAYWWPAAFEDALWHIGTEQGYPDILSGGGVPSVGLEMLTGYPAANVNNPARWWDVLMGSQTSPVILGTKGDITPMPNAKANAAGAAGAAPGLHPAHGYAVLGALVDSEGTQQVALANPWGVEKDASVGQWVPLASIIDDIDYLSYLPKGQNGPNQ